jgi:PAS domain S-box-containing protein
MPPTGSIEEDRDVSLSARGQPFQTQGKFDMSDNPARDEEGATERSAMERDGGFLVVGLGASAGGIQALKEFFSRVNAPTGMAYVVTLHLSPEHEGRLAEILQTVTPLPVTHVTEAVRVRPDHVYIIPQNQSLTMSDGMLALSHPGFGERLRESEEQFRRAIEDAPIPVIMHAEDGEMLQVSRTWTELTGYDLEDVPTLDAWLTRAYSEGADAVRDHMHELFKGERRSLAVEFPVRTRAGGVRRWSFNASSPGTLRDGRRYIVGMALDITERHEAEERLRESGERLKKAIGIETVGVLFLDMEGTFTDANDAFLMMSGFTREQIESRRVNTADMTLPEWMPRSEVALEELKTAWRTTPYEKELRRPDGSHWWGLFAATRLDEAEAVEYVIDVTERRRAEEALRAGEQRVRSIVGGVTEYAIITQDTEGRIETWNPGAELMFGYTADEAMGRSIEIIFTPEDRACGAHLEEMRRAREEGRAPDERWHVRKDGSRFYVSGVLSPLGDRTPTGYVKIARDLTRQKQAEDALLCARDELEERVRDRTLELAEANVALQAEVRERRAAEERIKNLLRQLVTIQEDERRRIARDLHDHLGQQMTALRLNLESLKQNCDNDERAREKIEQAQASAARIDADVDFLAWELRPAALDDLGLAATLADFVKEFSRHFGVPTEFHARGFGRKRLAPEIETNLYRIAQEALNNVHKHAAAGKADVLLELRDERVVMIVEDDGRGFDQVESAAERNGGDRGLGLVGMRERAALVGGTVEIETSPGEGTTVFVRVPAEFDRAQTKRRGGKKRE